MNPRAGSVRRPIGPARALVALTVRLLPREHRERYDDEFRADLVMLPRRRQVTQALELLAGRLALRSTLLEREGRVAMKLGVRTWLAPPTE